MIAIMIPIKPYWYAKILNGEKGIEVRKNKALARAVQKLIDTQEYAPILGYCTKAQLKVNGKYGYKKELVVNGNIVNGKVPALLICRKVDEWDIWQDDLDEKLKLACLSIKEFDDYSKGQVAYAIHISDLEIFDKPKELSDFKTLRNCNKCFAKDDEFECFNIEPYCPTKKPLTKAPQNYCYVEVGE